MRKILCFIFGVLFIRIASADTVNINWIVDDQTYDTSTCTVGGDIILPTAPTKRGYTFLGWEILLPDGYDQVQYVYMPEGSYLLTDIIPTYDDHYEMDFATATVSENSDTYLGARNGSTIGDGVRFGKSDTKRALFDWFTQGYRYTSSYVFADNTRYKFVVNNNSLTLSTGGLEVITNTFTPTGTTTYYLAINGFNINGVVTVSHDGIYLYSFKAWNAQGELIANYIPCIKTNQLTVGLFDTVSRTFKTATAGTFIAGSVVTE